MPDKPLPPSPPPRKHQRSIEVKSKTPTLTNRLERRKRLIKPDFPDRKEVNEKSNEIKNDPNRKRRRRRRHKDHKSPLNKPETAANEPEAAPNETLNYIWDQVETIGTNVFKYFWPEEAEVPTIPQEKNWFDSVVQIQGLIIHQ